MTNDEQMQELLLFEAINQQGIDEVKRLLASGINREVIDKDGQTPLHHAVGTKKLEKVELLLEENLGTLNLMQFITHQDNAGKTALHLAAENCAVDIIRYLRTKSNNLLDSIKDNKGFTALDGIRMVQTMKKSDKEKSSAEEKSRINNVIQVLIEYPNLKNVIIQLDQYIMKGDLAAVKELIEKDPELLESRNTYTNTPLFEAIYSEQFVIADYLIETGADVDARCHEGKISLHRAVWVKNKDIVLKLIKKGANVNALDDHSGTPLLDAAGSDENAEIIELLLNYGATLNSSDGLSRNVIHIAATNNCYKNIKYFFKKINDIEIFERPTGFGRSPLHFAAEQGCIESIQILVELGCEINRQDNFGRTPFHIAAEKDRVKALQCLLKLGCKMDILDDYLRTPLHVAATSGAISTAEYLLNNGTKLEATDGEGRTPLHLAARYGQLRMIEYLIEKNADLLKKDTNNCTPLEVAKTHPDSYIDPAKKRKAYDLLSGKKKWQAQPRSSQASQRVYWAPQKSERNERQFSKSDKSEEATWRPRRP